MPVFYIADSAHTYADNKLMSIDANNNSLIHELMVNNPQTCSIFHSPWAGNAIN